jgi:hypothetical protein
MEPEEPLMGPEDPEGAPDTLEVPARPGPSDTAELPEPPQQDQAEEEADGEQRRSRRPALLARFPRLFWRPDVDHEWPDDPKVVKRKHLVRYGELRGDLGVWVDDVEPRWRRLDHRARILQNQFWRQHLALIFGGLVATILGAIQAAVGGGVVALAVAQAVLAGVLAGLTVLIRSRRVQQRFLTARLSAERVKSEYFLYLGRVGEYDEPDREFRLGQQVSDIEAAEGAA